MSITPLSTPTPKPPVQVLVVDDSRVARVLIKHILESDPQIQVVGMVEDGLAALDFVAGQKPDVVLMDIQMPGMDGFETTRRIMETRPVPIIICSGVMGTDEASTAFRVMEAGAVACIAKPTGPENSSYEQNSTNLRQTIRLMSEVKVVRRWASARTIPLRRAVAPPPNPAIVTTRCIGIGASTGGPPVLQSILAELPKDFPAPILIVQHIAPGFLPGMADWLNQTSPLQISIGAHGIEALPGHVYLAPDDFHLGLGPNGRLALSKAPPESGLRPAVSHLFRTLRESCGAKAIGVLLTGMGRDGADELKLLKDHGAVTIAQDRETSVVHGMPGEAIAINGATHILAAEKIASVLAALVRPKTSGNPTP